MGAISRPDSLAAAKRQPLLFVKSTPDAEWFMWQRIL
jgi:hypothetical protein